MDGESPRWRELEEESRGKGAVLSPDEGAFA